MVRTAELGIGYAQPQRQRQPGHDAQLAKLIEKRNAARALRDREQDLGLRAGLQSELRELQRSVKKRLELVRERVIDRRNAALGNCRSKNPGVYWDLLKRTVGIRRKKVAMPEEVLFDGVVVCGDKIREAWREAFRRVFAVDGENSFNKEFLEEIQKEVKAESLLSLQFDTLNSDLNQPIAEEEVLSIIGTLKPGKAAGVDALVNEIFKYGGDGIGKATAKLCEELQLLTFKFSLKTEICTESKICTKTKNMHQVQKY